MPRRSSTPNNRASLPVFECRDGGYLTGTRLLANCPTHPTACATVLPDRRSSIGPWCGRRGRRVWSCRGGVACRRQVFGQRKALALDDRLAVGGPRITPVDKRGRDGATTARARRNRRSDRHRDRCYRGRTSSKLGYECLTSVYGPRVRRARTQVVGRDGTYPRGSMVTS